MTKHRILFISGSLVPCIRKDLEILNKKFKVYLCIWKDMRTIPKLIRGVLITDLNVSWFAGGHAFLAVLFSKLLGKKSIVIVGGGEVAAVPEIDYGGMRKHKRSGFFAKFVLKYADVILPVSEFTKKEVLKYAKPEILKIIYNGVDTEKFKPSGAKEDFVMTVASGFGDIIKLKGLDTFIKCADHLPNAKFSVIGLSKKDITRLRSMKKFDNVALTGYLPQEELINHYQKAKVYCQLSYRESFGMALAEAMACKCTPVVTNRGALPEVVGNTGFYVPYGDPEATAKAIKKALNSDNGKKSRERIINMFSINKKEEELVGIIEAVIR